MPDDKRVITRLSSVTTRRSAQYNTRKILRQGNYSDMADTTRENLERFVARKKLSIKPWAKAAGVSDSAVRAFLKGRTMSLTHSTLEKLAVAAGTTVSEMLREPQNRPEASQFVKIKHLEVHASAGGGFEVTSEPEGEPYYFKKSWLENMFGGHDGKLRVIHFDGDSMLPTIQNGDVGIVLTGESGNEFQSGRIYVLWDGRGLVVKRLEAVISSRPRLRVISDNKDVYTAYEIDAEDAHVVGRVLWRAGKI